MDDIGRAINKLSGDIHKVAKRQYDRAAAETQQRARDEMIAIVSVTFEKAAAYSNLIMLSGYAGAFAIWSYTRDQLAARASITIAISLATSLMAFVVFEIYKMIVHARIGLKQRNLLIKKQTADAFLNSLEQLRYEINENGLKWLMPTWITLSSIAVISAVFAMALLFYNFFAILIGFSQWPS